MTFKQVSLHRKCYWSLVLHLYTITCLHHRWEPEGCISIDLVHHIILSWYDDEMVWWRNGLIKKKSIYYRISWPNSYFKFISWLSNKFSYISKVLLVTVIIVHSHTHYVHIVASGEKQKGVNSIDFVHHNQLIVVNRRCDGLNIYLFTIGEGDGELRSW